MVMDVSITEANLIDASFQWVCNLVTHCSVFVQLGLRKEHLFSGIEGSIQSLTEAKGEGLGACPLRTLCSCNFKLEVHDGETIIIFSCKCKRFKLYFDATSYSRDWWFYCTQTCRHDTLVQCNPFKHAEGLSFNYRASDVKYFNLTFFLQCWEPLNIYCSVPAHAGEKRTESKTENKTEEEAHT